MPSAGPSATSLGISRTVEVTGATVISFIYSMMEVRVSTTTGRFLSGWVNLYQRTSPRFTRRPRLVLPPKPRPLHGWPGATDNPFDAVLPIA